MPVSPPFDNNHTNRLLMPKKSIHETRNRDGERRNKALENLLVEKSRRSRGNDVRRSVISGASGYASQGTESYFGRESGTVWALLGKGVEEGSERRGVCAQGGVAER